MAIVPERERARRPRRFAQDLPRNVRVLSWVSFFQDAASELLYPIWPLFITVTLGAPASALGLIEGVAEGTASAGKAIFGRLADRHRRRPLVALGYGISSAAKPLMGLATAWPFALVGRFVDRTGKGIRTAPRDALIAGDTSPEIRGRAFGYHRAFDTAGAVVGPLLGLGLYEALNHHLRPLFFFAAVPGAISVALIAFVRERPAAAPVAGAERAPSVPLRALPRRYWRVTLALSLFGLVNFSDALLILRANELGLSFVSVILVYTLYNAAYAGLSLPAGIVSDRIPRRAVFGVGLLIFAVAYLGLGLARSSGWVWLLLPLYGAYTALTDGVGKAWVSDLLPAGAMGTGLGLFQGLSGGCALIASVWAGLAWGGDGRTPLLISGMVVAVLGLALLALGRRLDGDARQST
ncbi:MAG TPA: MFS transporter [Conexibacter sp.]|nr:MFS transporter [Conexibacter sp.]